MTTFLALLFLALMAVSQLLHILSMPANWVLLVLVIVFKAIQPQVPMTWGFILGLGAIAAGGEAVEFAAQYWGCKRFGGSTRGNIGAFGGAILGAILGASFLLGIGAIPGALAGGFAGSYFMEATQGRPRSEAWRAAWGALWGRLFGMVVKASLGVVMLFLAAPRMWGG